MQADWLQPGFIALVIHVNSRGSISLQLHFLALGQIAKLCGARVPLCVYLDAPFLCFRVPFSLDLQPFGLMCIYGCRLSLVNRVQLPDRAFNLFCISCL